MDRVGRSALSATSRVLTPLRLGSWKSSLNRNWWTVIRLTAVVTVDSSTMPISEFAYILHC